MVLGPYLVGGGTAKPLRGTLGVGDEPRRPAAADRIVAVSPSVRVFLSTFELSQPQPETTMITSYNTKILCSETGALHGSCNWMEYSWRGTS